MVLDPGAGKMPADVLFSTETLGENEVTYRIDTKRPGPNSWDIMLIGVLPEESFEKGETLRLSFSARGPERNAFNVSLQQNRAPYATYFTTRVAPTTDWERYEFTFPAPVLAADRVQVVFHVGEKPGRIELREIALVRLKVKGKR